MNRSLTIKGVFITFLAWAFMQAGMKIDSEQVRTFVEVATGIAQLIGIVMAYVGRWRHGDITLLGKRKNTNGER